MAEQPLNKSTKKKKSAAGSRTKVGDIHIGGGVGGPFVVGNNNVINLSPEQQVFRSLHQLPQPPADFTGREELIAQLLADFEKGKGATITGQPVHGLVGMGGIGKTTLGLVVAHQLKKDYPDAQIFLDLKSTTKKPLSAMDAMRHVILSFEPGMDLRALDEADKSTAYRSVLHGKRVLLFFDNARSAEQVAPLRPPETCALLVTSRWTFGVPGLKNRHVSVMNQKNAEKFLLELCPRIGDQANELAKACAYLPLALRIAGSFLQVNDDYSIDTYLRELDDQKARLGTLGENRKEAELGTEPDLVVTFKQSYNQLAKEKGISNVQKYWRTLGIFSTSFTSTALEAIWELDTKEAAQRVRLYKRYSLIDFDETKMRYSLHDLLAAYALSQMKKEEEREARLKHAAHYKNILRTANQLYREGGAKVLTSLRLLDLEWENIQAGQAWVASSKETDIALSRLCVQYPLTGATVLNLRRHPGERIKWLEPALSAARQLGDRRGEGNALRSLGLAYADLGDVRKAIEFYEQALIIHREIGNHREEGATTGNLGTAYKNLGEVRKAIEFYEQALAIIREIGDRRGEGTWLGSLGNAYADLGEIRKAIEFYEGHLTIAREIGNRRGEGNALGSLGVAYKNLGEFRKAIEFYEQALAIIREVGDRRGEGTLLGNLGLVYYRLGEVRKAIEFYEQALAIVREIGDRRGEGNSSFNMGLALYDLKKKDRAIDLMKQALAIYEAIEAPTAEYARNQLKEWGAL